MVLSCTESQKPRHIVHLRGFHVRHKGGATGAVTGEQARRAAIVEIQKRVTEYISAHPSKNSCCGVFICGDYNVCKRCCVVGVS